MEEIKYSEAFVAKVKRLYPTFTDMHRHADGNSYMLGRYLDDSSSGGINYDTILKSSSLEELKKIATEAKEKIELYIEWGKEVGHKY